MKSALLEREMGDIQQTLLLLDEGIARYPTFAKYYMMAGQACAEGLNDLSRAREYYQKGLKQCPNSVPLWLLVVRLEEAARGANKARSMMELARLKMPLNEEVWLESIRLERRAGNDKMAESLMAKALQDCPNSGLLWAEEITTCPKVQQKSKSVEALKRCDNDPFVIVAVARLVSLFPTKRLSATIAFLALYTLKTRIFTDCHPRLFEKDRKFPKARKWFDRAVTLNPRLGDAWAHFYAFELRQSVSGAATAGGEGSEGASKSEAESVLKRCVTAEPNRGKYIGIDTRYAK
jgi:pre-mRNA-processing factor 6